MMHVETTPRSLTWRGRVLRTVLSASLLLLPAAPALAQTDPAQSKKVEDAVNNKYREVVIHELGDALVAPPAADLDKLRAELEKLQADLQMKKAEAEKLQAQLEAARARIAQAEKAKVDRGAGLEMRIVEVEKKTAPPQEITLRFVDGTWRIVETAKDPRKTLAGWFDGGGLKVIEQPTMPPAAPMPPPVVRPGAGPGNVPMAVPPQPSNTPDARIDNLERKLEKVMQMIEQMRREMEGSRKKAEAPAAPADIERAARDAAEAAEIRALRDREAAVQKELDRVELLKRALEEAGQKKLVPPAPQPPKQ